MYLNTTKINNVILTEDFSFLINLAIGILMLTTNQISQFDVVVQSRIHIVIKFDHLNKDQIMTIFRGFLEPMAKNRLIDKWEAIQEWLMDDVAAEGLGGRQIRNIVTSALGLARAEKSQQLTLQHIKKVLNNTKAFKKESITQFEKYKIEQQGMI